MEYITGYEMAKIVNEMLASRHMKTIPAQMIYTYMRKGYINTEIVDGQRLVSTEEAAKWSEKYIARKALK